MYDYFVLYYLTNELRILRKRTQNHGPQTNKKVFQW
jgi:hypothetical protein